MTRISYRLNEEGCLISNLFFIKDGMAFVMIKPKENILQIRSIDSDDTVTLLLDKECSNLEECKREARTFLISIGVTFQDEVHKKV